MIQEEVNAVDREGQEVSTRAIVEHVIRDSGPAFDSGDRGTHVGCGYQDFTRSPGQGH